MRIQTEALGHTFNIMPGDAYSLGDDGTFALRWNDNSICTYRIVVGLEDMSYDVERIPAEECTADLSNFTPFFTEGMGEEEEDDYDDWDDSDGLSDAEADAMTLASAGWGTDEDYGYFGGDEW